MRNGLTRLIRRLFQEQRGTVVVLVALSMVSLLGFTALVTDAGLLYLAKTELANSVDAAALAGGQNLLIDRETAESTASEYAAQNGADAGEITVTVSDDAREITVTGRRTVNLFFARVLGHQTGEVRASATARVGPISSISGAAPLSIGRQEFVYGERYYLKDAPGGEGSGDPTHRAGWYGALSLGGKGACRYRENLKDGFSGVLRVGDVVDTETGNMSGPTGDGISYRLESCHHSPACTFASFQRDCPRVLMVPVVEPYDWSGRQVKKVRVVGFAAFYVEEAPGDGNDNQVVGRFVRTIASGAIDPGGSEFGLYGVKLVH